MDQEKEEKTDEIDSVRDKIAALTLTNLQEKEKYAMFEKQYQIRIKSLEMFLADKEAIIANLRVENRNLQRTVVTLIDRNKKASSA